MLYFLLLGWLKAVFERLLIKPFLEMIKTDAVFYCETSCLGTAEGGKVGATIESPADITGEGADISAFAANHTDAGGLLLIVIIGEFYLVYTHGLRQAEPLRLPGARHKSGRHSPLRRCR